MFTTLKDIICNVKYSVAGPDNKVSDVDGQLYSLLLYGNGPGYSVPRTIPTNSSSSEEQRNSVHASAVPRQWATHGGEDVPVYALGPLATILFTGTFDQSYIPHAIAYSACLGEFAQRCNSYSQSEPSGNNSVDNNNQICISTQFSSGVSSGSSSPEIPPGAPVVKASSVMTDDVIRNQSHRISGYSIYNISLFLLFTFICNRILSSTTSQNLYTTGLLNT